jgi:hypothetical protein
MATAKIATIDREGVEDRAFRIMHNHKQVQLDRCSITGLVVGGLLRGPAMSVGQGAAAGFALATLAWMAKEGVLKGWDKVVNKDKE